MLGVPNLITVPILSIIFLCLCHQVLTASSMLMGGVAGASAKGGWSDKPTQYHIQTDEGPERFFRYQVKAERGIECNSKDYRGQEYKGVRVK